MKISNIKNLKFICYALALLNLIPILGIFFFNQSKWDIAFTLLIMLFVLLLSNLRCIEYDDTGECITIRRFHPYTTKRFIKPSIEFPKSYVEQINLDEGLILDRMKIKIQSKTSKKQLKVNLLCFNKNQISYIKNSINTISARN